MRKARRISSIPLSVKLPSKRVRERFLIIYELEGCQKAVNYLTRYYRVRRMKIFLNGRKVGKGCLGLYLENGAYFKKEGLNRKIVLHELYHHLVEARNLEMRLVRQPNHCMEESAWVSKAHYTLFSTLY